MFRCKSSLRRILAAAVGFSFGLGQVLPAYALRAGQLREQTGAALSGARAGLEELQQALQPPDEIPPSFIWKSEGNRAVLISNGFNQFALLDELAARRGENPKAEITVVLVTGRSVPLTALETLAGVGSLELTALESFRPAVWVGRKPSEEEGSLNVVLVTKDSFHLDLTSNNPGDPSVMAVLQAGEPAQPQERLQSALRRVLARNPAAETQADVPLDELLLQWLAPEEKPQIERALQAARVLLEGEEAASAFTPPADQRARPTLFQRAIIALGIAALFGSTLVGPWLEHSSEPPSKKQSSVVAEYHEPAPVPGTQPAPAPAVLPAGPEKPKEPSSLLRGEGKPGPANPEETGGVKRSGEDGSAKSSDIGPLPVYPVDRVQRDLNAEQSGRFMRLAAPSQLTAGEIPVVILFGETARIKQVRAETRDKRVVRSEVVVQAVDKRVKLWLGDDRWLTVLPGMTAIVKMEEGKRTVMTLAAAEQSRQVNADHLADVLSWVAPGELTTQTLPNVRFDGTMTVKNVSTESTQGGRPSGLVRVSLQAPEKRSTVVTIEDGRWRVSPGAIAVLSVPYAGRPEILAGPGVDQLSAPKVMPGKGTVPPSGGGSGPGGLPPPPTPNREALFARLGLASNFALKEHRDGVQQLNDYVNSEDFKSQLHPGAVLPRFHAVYGDGGVALAGRFSPAVSQVRFVSAVRIVVELSGRFWEVGPGIPTEIHWGSHWFVQGQRRTLRWATYVTEGPGVQALDRLPEVVKPPPPADPKRSSSTGAPWVMTIRNGDSVEKQFFYPDKTVVAQKTRDQGLMDLTELNRQVRLLAGKVIPPLTDPWAAATLDGVKDYYPVFAGPDNARVRVLGTRIVERSGGTDSIRILLDIPGSSVHLTAAVPVTRQPFNLQENKHPVRTQAVRGLTLLTLDLRQWTTVEALEGRDAAGVRGADQKVDSPASAAATGIPAFYRISAWEAMRQIRKAVQDHLPKFPKAHLPLIEFQEGDANLYLSVRQEGGKTLLQGTLVLNDGKEMKFQMGGHKDSVPPGVQVEFVLGDGVARIVRIHRPTQTTPGSGTKTNAVEVKKTQKTVAPDAYARWEREADRAWRMGGLLPPVPDPELSGVMFPKGSFRLLTTQQEADDFLAFLRKTNDYYIWTRSGPAEGRPILVGPWAWERNETGGSALESSSMILQFLDAGLEPRKPRVGDWVVPAKRSLFTLHGAAVPVAAPFRDGGAPGGGEQTGAVRQASFQEPGKTTGAVSASSTTTATPISSASGAEGGGGTPDLLRIDPATVPPLPVLTEQQAREVSADLEAAVASVQRIVFGHQANVTNPQRQQRIASLLEQVSKTPDSELPKLAKQIKDEVDRDIDDLEKDLNRLVAFLAQWRREVEALRNQEVTAAVSQNFEATLKAAHARVQVLRESVSQGLKPISIVLGRPDRTDILWLRPVWLENLLKTEAERLKADIDFYKFLSGSILPAMQQSGVPPQQIEARRALYDSRIAYLQAHVDYLLDAKAGAMQWVKILREEAVNPGRPLLIGQRRAAQGRMNRQILDRIFPALERFAEAQERDSQVFGAGPLALQRANARLNDVRAWRTQSIAIGSPDPKLGLGLPLTPPMLEMDLTPGGIRAEQEHLARLRASELDLLKLLPEADLGPPDGRIWTPRVQLPPLSRTDPASRRVTQSKTPPKRIIDLPITRRTFQPDVLIGDPGSMWDLAKEKTKRDWLYLNRVRTERVQMIYHPDLLATRAEQLDVLARIGTGPGFVLWHSLVPYVDPGVADNPDVRAHWERIQKLEQVRLQQQARQWQAERQRHGRARPVEDVARDLARIEKELDMARRLLKSTGPGILLREYVVDPAKQSYDGSLAELHRVREELVLDPAAAAGFGAMVDVLEQAVRVNQAVAQDQDLEPHRQRNNAAVFRWFEAEAARLQQLQQRRPQDKSLSSRLAYLQAQAGRYQELHRAGSVLPVPWMPAGQSVLTDRLQMLDSQLPASPGYIKIGEQLVALLPSGETVRVRLVDPFIVDKPAAVPWKTPFYEKDAATGLLVSKERKVPVSAQMAGQRRVVPPWLSVRPLMIAPFHLESGLYTLDAADAYEFFGRGYVLDPKAEAIRLGAIIRIQEGKLLEPTHGLVGFPVYSVQDLPDAKGGTQKEFSVIGIVTQEIPLKEYNKKGPGNKEEPIRLTPIGHAPDGKPIFGSLATGGHVTYGEKGIAKYGKQNNAGQLLAPVQERAGARLIPVRKEVRVVYDETAGRWMLSFQNYPYELPKPPKGGLEEAAESDRFESSEVRLPAVHVGVISASAAAQAGLESLAGQPRQMTHNSWLVVLPAGAGLEELSGLMAPFVGMDASVTVFGDTTDFAVLQRMLQGVLPVLGPVVLKGTALLDVLREILANLAGLEEASFSDQQLGEIERALGLHVQM